MEKVGNVTFGGVEGKVAEMGGIRRFGGERERIAREATTRWAFGSGSVWEWLHIGSRRAQTKSIAGTESASGAESTSSASVAGTTATGS